MKGTMRRAVSIVLALAMVITSLSYTPKTVEAAEGDEVIFDESRVMDSTYNLAYGKTVSLIGTDGTSKDAAGKDIQCITDGGLGDPHGIVLDEIGKFPGTTGNASVTIDLGKYYPAASIDRIIVRYKNKEANATVVGNSYRIQYSVHGKFYRDIVKEKNVVAVDLDENNQTVDNVSELADGGNVRFVRIDYPTTQEYGMHINEVVILDTDGDAVETTPITLDNADFDAGVENNQIKVNIKQGEAQNDYQYYILVDGNIVKGPVAAGEYILEDIVTAGEYKVSVVSYRNGATSDQTNAKSVKVNIRKTDLTEQVNDPLYNLAYQQTATAFGVKEGEIGKITDGNLKGDKCSITDGKNWGTLGGATYFTVDLGNYYQADTIDQIIVRYDGAGNDVSVSGHSYGIQYSVHGSFYRDAVPVKEVTSLDAATPQTVDDVSGVEGNVRFIRVNYPETPKWGMQVQEIVVLDTDGNAKKVTPIELDKPVYTATAEKYNKIKVNIESVETQSDYEYYIVLDDVTWGKVNAGEHVLENIEAGTHTVHVISYKNGLTSNQKDDKGITVEVKAPYSYVSGTKNELLEDHKEINGIYCDDYIKYDGVTADASTNTGSVGNAFDENINSGWQADKSDNNAYFLINLGKKYNIHQIEEIWESASAKDYTIEVSVDGESYETVASIKNGPTGQNRLDTIHFEEQVVAQYVKIQSTARNDAGWGIYLRDIAIYGSPEYDYAPQGLTATQMDSDVTISWMAPKDAGKPGYLGDGYKVVLDGQEQSAIDCTTTFDMTEKAYGSYDVVVNTVDAVGNVLDSATITFNYKDPNKVDSELNVVYQWKGFRREILSWTAVENATGYAVYADGKLYGTTTELSMNVRAYAYANGINSNGQPTTIGSHTTKVVALFNNEKAPAYSDINENNEIGTDQFNLDRNFIFGRFTNIWNKNTERSLWAVTIKETTDYNSGMDRAANAKMEFNADGSAKITINDVGKSSNPEQQKWTVKGASYNAEVATGYEVHLAYDIKGPAELIGKELYIKLCAKEVDEATGEDRNDPNSVYSAKMYTFKADTDGNAVIHFSEKFTPIEDTYDILLGLGELQDKDNPGNPIEIELGERRFTQVYGVSKVTASSVRPNIPDSEVTQGQEKHGILVSWETDVPYRLRKDYRYEVWIDGVKVSGDIDAVTGTTWYGVGNTTGKDGENFVGYSHGNHKVEVRSLYKDTEIEHIQTGVAETTVDVYDRAEGQADLIVKSMVVVDGDKKDYYPGDEVPVKIQIQNISTHDTQLREANKANPIVVHLHINDINGAELGWAKVPGDEIKAGETKEITINFTLNREYAGTAWRYALVAQADADDNVIEGELGEKNNTYTRIFVFPDTPDEVKFAHTGDNKIQITWKTSEFASKYAIYRVNAAGERTEIAQTANNSYVLSKILDNGTIIEVDSIRANGAEVLRARGTALADLKMVDFGPTATNHTIYAHRNNEFVFKVQNVGFAKTNAQFPVKVEGSSSYKMTENVSLNPNDTAEITCSNAVVAGKYADNVGTRISIRADVDDASETQGNGYVEEVDDKNVAKDYTRNNFMEKEFTVLTKATLILTAPETEGGNTTATFTDTNVTSSHLTPEKYTLKYTSNGEDKIKQLTVEEAAGTIIFDSPIDNNTNVEISAKYTELEETCIVAREKALADLVIEQVTLYDNNKHTLLNDKTYWERPFDATVRIKNIGVAQVLSSSKEFEEGYGGWIIVGIDNNNFKNAQEDTYISKHNADGLVAGGSKELTLTDIRPQALSTTENGEKVPYVLDFKVDYPGNHAITNGYIAESDETNNTLPKNIIVEQYVRGTADWIDLNYDLEKTPLEEGADPNEPAKAYPFKVANMTQPAKIQYKVLDVSEAFHCFDYDEIVQRCVGYNNEYFTLQLATMNAQRKIFVEDAQGFYTLTEFAQIRKEECDNYEQHKDEVVERSVKMSQAGKDILDKDGNVIVEKAQSDLGYNGEGFNYYANAFAQGKYYIYKMTNTKTGEYVTVAMRVTGDEEQWTKAYATDPNYTDADKLKFDYHGEACEFDKHKEDFNKAIKAYQTTGAFYYDNSDLGLSSITCYARGQLTLVPDATHPINPNNWKIEIARAGVDNDGNFVKPAEDVNGNIQYDKLIEPSEAFQHQGTTRLLLNLGKLMEGLPIHSDKGGQKDENYYFMRLYTDIVNYPQKHIDIPVMIRADIPMIEAPQEENVFSKIRQDDEMKEVILSLSWKETAKQAGYDYHYDVELYNTTLNEETGKKEPVETPFATVSDAALSGHVFDVTDYAIDSTSEIFVKLTAHWCGQSVSYTRSVQNNYEEGWRKIGGTPEIDVHVGKQHKVSVLGTFSFYDDVLENHTYLVTGYNGMYINIQGNENYIGQDKDSTDEHLKKPAELYISKGVANPDAITDEALPTLDYSHEATNKVYEQTLGQMKVNTQEEFQITYQTTYYGLKIVKGDKVTYIKMKVEVTPGDVELKAFQMNTDTSEGAVSEMNPSFRTVSRASKVVALDAYEIISDEKGNEIENHQITSVKSYGTLYSVDEELSGNTLTTEQKLAKMQFSSGKYDAEMFKAGMSVETSEGTGIYAYGATVDVGTLKNWSNATDKNSFYYALTFKAKTYYLDMLDKDYTMRAYAVTEDNDIIYGKNIATTSIYKIAEVLYNGNLMSAKSSHDFLYNHVLNIVYIKNNRQKIANAMVRALGVTSTKDEKYALINNMYKDLYRYITLTGVYKVDRYYKREAFACKTQTNGQDTEKALLEFLNTVTTDGKKYTTVADWIVNETVNHDKDKTCIGFYKKVEFVNKTTLVEGSDI